MELPKEERLEALQNLIETTGFEEFLHKKYPGSKRFSVEGAEGSIVALEFLIKHSHSMIWKNVLSACLTGAESILLGRSCRSHTMPSLLSSQVLIPFRKAQYSR